MNGHREKMMSPARRADLARDTFVVMLVIGVVLLAVKLSNVLLLVFAGVVFSALLRLIGDPIRYRLGLSRGLSILAAIAILAAILGLTGWLFGAQLSAQFSEISGRIPSGIGQFRSMIERLPFGEQIAGGLNTLPSSGFLSGVAGFAMTTVGALANLLVVIVGGIFIATAPRYYFAGIAGLFPDDARPNVRDALEAIDVALGKFLQGQLLTMLIDGVLAGIGLWLIGVPAPLALGVFLGVVNFIPFFGPFIGAIPGVLVALTAGPMTALYAAGVYLVVSQLEGNLVSPLLQQRLVSLPPALTIFAVLAFSVLFGTLGAIVAAPLTAMLYTGAIVLWAQDALDEDVKTPGTNNG
ncbi:MAG: hypothetical protein B7Y45_08650 [Sphingomonas sp. 28-66-16]|nr:MAG: hypothetical protein B7Y45_08650 [Sphingomonas sp. 28-66-16]